MNEEIQVDKSDLRKIRDVMVQAHAFMLRRDQMNAYVHMARECRQSPLTSQMGAEVERLDAMLGICDTCSLPY